MNPKRVLVRITEEDEGLFAELFLPSPIVEFLTTLAATAPEKISTEARTVLVKHGYGYIFENENQEPLYGD